VKPTHVATAKRAATTEFVCALIMFSLSDVFLRKV
jgi:hypothetical protein